MATSDSQSQQGATVPDREVAKLVFAAEVNEATYTFKLVARRIPRVTAPGEEADNK
jgi:RPA family protein